MDPIGQLILVVEELLHEHEAFLQVAERKKQTLIKGDIDTLQEILNVEVSFVRKIEALEEERMRQGQQIAELYNLQLEELTATKLAALIENPEQVAKLKLLTGRFAKVVGDLQAVNDLNGQLIRQSLDLVQRTIEMITDVPGAGLYTGKGDTGQAAGQRRFFDTQA
ncbi:flagellar protein FlgN [Effusibacillus dendaii]|uniref:Flagellar protein FlgN n=1 Tax=Effusibacillus dendaii TaxID=2743772 RepID=A0A7I8DCF0_9BACL|nr:flagellar protein FlgN [Effusibacillus dendaii]BCJ87863.1 hypothetical protein skT53_28480 [Effusibacillus dendaii]